MLKFKKHDDKPKDKDKDSDKEKETKSTHRSRSPIRRRSRSPPRRRSRSPSRRDRSPVRYSSRSPPRRRSRSPRRRSPRRDERRSKDRSRSRSPPKPTTTTRDANQGVKRVYKKKPQYNLIEVEVNDRLGKKVRVKCSPDDSVGDFKKLLSAQIGTPAAKIVLKKWYKEYKDHISLSDYEIHDGMNLELYYR